MKKGFTLIELLAVIVILAIIAVIAVPIVLDIIDDTKQSSTLRSVDNILKGAELYASAGLMNNENLNGNIYEEVMKTIDRGKPDSGNIYVNSKGEIAFSFKYNNYCYTKGYEDSEVKVEKTDTCITPVDYLIVQKPTTSETEPVFESNLPRNKIEKVYTKSTNIVPIGVIDSFDVSAAKNGSIMAWYMDEDNNGLYELYIGQDGGVKANPDSSRVFNFFVELVEIDLSNFDTSNVTFMNAMFQNCPKLASLDLSNFNTSNVIDLSYMFNYCCLLTDLDLSNFNTSSVTNMSVMFQNCRNLINLDTSSFDTSNVTDMKYMFFKNESLIEIDLSNFDTSNVTDMAYMFYDMYNLKELNLSSFDTSNVTNMSYMFFDMNNLKELNLSSFDTSNVTTMEAMFYNAKNLKTLKLDKATFTKISDYGYMFTGAKVLSNITVKDNNAKTFIEARLKNAGLSGTVTVAQ